MERVVPGNSLAMCGLALPKFLNSGNELIFSYVYFTNNFFLWRLICSTCIFTNANLVRIKNFNFCFLICLNACNIPTFSLWSINAARLKIIFTCFCRFSCNSSKSFNSIWWITKWYYKFIKCYFFFNIYLFLCYFL